MHTVFEILNIFFIVFHTAWILFNCIGWLYRPWLRWNLLTLLITAFSWFALGAFYGWGFCLCTDWHWQVRQKLGYSIETDSYIQFLIRILTGMKPEVKLVDTLTAGIFVLSLVISMWKNFKAKRNPA